MKAPAMLSAWFGARRGGRSARRRQRSAALGPLPAGARRRLAAAGEYRCADGSAADSKRIEDEDLLALPALYRTAASSLAVARETSLDAATLTYLEGLVQRAWFQVYGPRKGFAAWLRDFVCGGWSRAVRAIWLDICIALFVMVAGAIVGWLLVARDEAMVLPARPRTEWPMPACPAQAARNCSPRWRPRKARWACRPSPPICSATMPPSASSPSRWALPSASRRCCCWCTTWRCWARCCGCLQVRG